MSNGTCLPELKLILQLGDDLRSNSHRSRPDCANNCAVLFRIENSTALRVTLETVLAGLEQNDPILVVFDGQGHITPAPKTIWTVIVVARETVRCVVARTVNLQMKYQK